MIEQFLRDMEAKHGGNRLQLFREQVDSDDYRQGQAFMNALRGTPEYEKLTGSYHDPFYSNLTGRIIDAINYVRLGIND